MEPMKFNRAAQYALSIKDWLDPYCQVLEIAGSVRRQRPFCNDIDLVAIAKEQVTKDLLGEVTTTRNLLHDVLDEYVTEYKKTHPEPVPEPVAWLQRGGSDGAGGCNLFVRLPKCELNVFCAQPNTVGAVYLTYTGSKEHNIWISKRARRFGYRWRAREGLWGDDGIVAPKSTSAPLEKQEEEIYARLKLPWIPPALREIILLEKAYGREE